MSITVRQVSKKFGDFQALKEIDLHVEPGTLVALLGPSGSGKSTLLRTIAGLETPDTGTVHISDRDTTHLDIRKRNIGFVFQHYALFKHLTVRKNIAFGLDIRNKPPKVIKQRVEELLELIQLQGFGDRYPHQLSGGQRQRVALARALAVQPEVLLLDEPFGALDAKVRQELRNWLRRLHEEVHLTSIFVTHDREEAMAVADKIVVMNQGKIEQIGTPAEIYDRPVNPFVMSFVGEVNVFPRTSFGAINHSSDRFEQVFIRPHDFNISKTPQAKDLPAVIKRVVHLGWEIQLELELIAETSSSKSERSIFMAHLSREEFQHLNLSAGNKVYLQPRQVKQFGVNDLSNVTVHSY
ncbi:sulfate/thiosulfate import ATP-binding protein cysA [Chondrocystis sp. NIES-4102]|nr:sulfate/thiosulfate import ATP-binding protein cysA [Chondrocystis sp. NIES-4102]